MAPSVALAGLDAVAVKRSPITLQLVVAEAAVPECLILTRLPTTSPAMTAAKQSPLTHPRLIGLAKPVTTPLR